MRKRQRQFGLYKSPYDKRDYLLRSFDGVYQMTLPKSVDLRAKMSPVRNQGQEGSCAGFAFAVGVKEYQETIDYDRPMKMSPRYIYEEAKKISGHEEGTTLKAIAQVALKKGCAEEEYWPYVPRVPGTPKVGTDKAAAKHKVKTYARIVNLFDLQSALASPKIGPVIIGVRVFKGMIGESAKATGVVPDPSCFDSWRPLGGHALCACGYEQVSPFFQDDGHILCKNSWGENYGDKGYCYLSFRYIERQMMDAFSCMDIEGSEFLLTVANLNYDQQRTAWV